MMWRGGRRSYVWSIRPRALRDGRDEALGGSAYGRVIGVIGAGLGAIGALLSIGGSNPWWSLAIFALCVYIVHGILALGDDERRPAT